MDEAKGDENKHHPTQRIRRNVHQVDGQARTMRFTTSEANLKKCGLITVYDVENRGLRKFNLSTLIGRIAMVPAAHALSFCR